MSMRLERDPHSRTTDHSEEIAALRAWSASYSEQAHESLTIPLALDCAAALLEVHDDTGISLDEWNGPRQLVEHCLAMIGMPGTFLANEV